MNVVKVLASQLVNNDIDIQDEMPVPKEEVVDINADDSDLDIIEVHCNINPKRANNIRRYPPNTFRRKYQNSLVNQPHQTLDVKEEIVISDSSDTECNSSRENLPKPNNRKDNNTESSLSSIILNCPRCNLTKTVYSTTLTSDCKDCKVSMTYVCNECNLKYTSLLALFRHKKVQCKKNLPALAQYMHRCLTCHAKYKACSLSKRRSCFKCKTPMAYECIICGKEVYSHPVIYRHLKNHCQPKERLMFCNDCPFKTTRQRSLLLHFSSVHRDLYQMNASCTKCDRSFANYITLEQHKSVCRAPYFYCKLCPYRPRLLPNFRRHLLVLHKMSKEDIPKIIKESLCAQTQGRVREVEKQIEQREGFVLEQITQVTCLSCNYEQPVVRGKNDCSNCKVQLVLQCLYCPARFRAIHLLQRHARRMHGKVEYVCQNCGKPFSFYGDFNEHRKWCGKEPRFKCRICPFKTRHRHNYNNHLKNFHSGDRQLHQCKDCHLCYKTEKGLNKHFEMGCIGTTSISLP